ncbi:STAS domain-containing protein [Micromonospora sp. LOL_025]|uniref:STAS domain-containing protein n=1 Tax=Micromonospora sp. LOL_025 TaxID=3345413 RepID=UPI003A8825A5
MSTARPSPDATVPASGTRRVRRAAPPVVSLSVTVQRTTRVVEVRGELDMSSAPLLVEFVELFCGGHAGEVRLDLSGVTFFSAHGITALLRVRQAVGLAGGRLTLPDPAPCVRRLLDLSGAARELPPDGGPRTAARPTPRRSPSAYLVSD